MPDAALDTGFFVVHTAWIAFNCLGWIWRRTRPWQLVTVSLTALSWVAFGPWYGWGYCPCTDWHWQVRARMGHVDPPSYIQLLASEGIGIHLERTVADVLAVSGLGTAGLLGAALTVRDRRSRVRGTPCRPRGRGQA